MTAFNRRDLVKTAGAAAAAALLPSPARSANVGLAPSEQLLAKTTAFLDLLEPDKRRAASFAWNAPEWKNWTYFGFPTLIKPGLRLEQMSEAQKTAAWDMLSTVLAPEGIAKARQVMLLQSILVEEGNRVSERSAERFSFSIFGTPAPAGTWGMRLEGHHLHHSISVRDGQIISVTPASFSALPNRVKRGRNAGLVTLAMEEDLARKLYADLATPLTSRARVAEQPLPNILSMAGRERANAAKKGVAAATLNSAQRDLLWEIVECYSVRHLAGPLADAQKARIRGGDPAAVHFAWYGPNTREKAFGYRIIGDTFVVELGSVDEAAQHLHTIYNDLGNVLGTAA